MKKYSDYPSDEKFDGNLIPWVKFKIIAESEEDKQELLKAFQYIHNLRIDTNYIVVNQLAHLYQDDLNDPCRIVVE